MRSFIFSLNFIKAIGIKTVATPIVKTFSILDKKEIKLQSENNSVETRLKSLKDLFDQELITQEEYDVMRKKVLGLN